MLSRMGSIISKFRTKPSTREQLEQIEADIQSIEDYKWTKMRQQKNLMALIFYGGGFMYGIVAIVFYFCFLPMTHNFYDKCLYSLPIVVLPVIAFMMQRSLQWYFRWVIEGNEDRLKELRKEKRKILDKVMETETYKVAKELLEKFDPSALKTDKSDSSLNARNIPGSPGSTGNNQSLRFRGPSPPNVNTPNRSFSSAPSPSPFASGAQHQMQRQVQPGMNPMLMQRQMAVNQGAMTSPRKFVRPILPGERSIVEKLVDYVVGDGPNNRFALICCYCHMHNGMALKYEFEFLAFRCCYCNTYNPPRKVRTNAPRIMAVPDSSQPRVEEPESDVDKTTTEDESQPETSVNPVSEVTEAGDERVVAAGDEITSEMKEQEVQPKEDDAEPKEEPVTRETTTLNSHEEEKENNEDRKGQENEIVLED